MPTRAYRRRIIALFIFVFVVFGLLTARLFYLQVMQTQVYSQTAEKQRKKLINIIPKRGDIKDRNNNPIAITVFLDSVNVDPQYLTTDDSKETVARELSEILDLDYKDLLKQFAKDDPITIARKITSNQSNRILQFMQNENLPRNAVYLKKQGVRKYPLADFASHIIGYTTFDDYGDNKGIEGIENTCDKYIKGSVEKAEALQDAIRNSLVPISSEKYRSTFGNDVILTIDEAIQDSAEKYLKEAVDKCFAATGSCVVLDCYTGEILAMANYPTYDPNRFNKYPDFLRKNRVIADAIEPGSVMKIFTAAVAIEAGVITPDDMIDCENGFTYLNKTRIRDTHKMGLVTFKEVIAQSSNIGTVKASMLLSKEQLYMGFRDFGFGKPTGIELSGESSGSLKNLGQWTEHSLSAIPIGQEISVTGLQIASSACAIANGGLLMKPHLVKAIVSSKGEIVEEFKPTVVKRVISETTSKSMTEILREVVVRGTGTEADIKGYEVAGKTGTAQIYDPELRQYSKDDYVGSFVGYLPADDPKIVIYVYIEKPRVGHYGGTVAAPVVKKVGEECMRILSVPKSLLAEEFEDEITTTTIVQNINNEKILDTNTTATITQNSINKEGEPEMGVMMNGAVASIEKVMPDLSGLTIAESMERISKYNINVKIVGSGLVVSQNPKPGEMLAEKKWCMIEFRN